MDVIQEFLKYEIYPNGMYEDIIHFITSSHIRSGEFEGNEYVIKKMDHSNFLVFSEYSTQNGEREIHFATSIYKFQLLEIINEYAKSQGICLSEV